MQQHQRLSRAMDFVVHLEAVHRNIARFCRSLADRHEPFPDTEHQEIQYRGSSTSEGRHPDRGNGYGLSCRAPSLASRARKIACARSATWSLVKIEDRWLATVFGGVLEVIGAVLQAIGFAGWLR